MSLLSLDQIKTLYDDLRGRIEANEEGTFPDMSVGSLISDEKISNNAPYLYRPVISGVGNRAWQKLVGATIAHNQLINKANFPSTRTANGVTFTNNGDGSITVSGTATAETTLFLDPNGSAQANIPVIDGHKYLLTGAPSGGSASTYYMSWGLAGNDTGDGKISNASPSRNIYCYIRIMSGATVNNLTFRPQITDLTADFGSTIADYAYTLETQTAGSGIAWLKSYGFFGKYAPYDAGSLISVKPTAKVVKNADETEEKTYDLGSDELRGLFKLDANNNIVGDGDIKTPDGTITRNWEEITLTGSEVFTGVYDSTYYTYIETNLVYDATAWQTDDIISNLADTVLTGGGAGTSRLYAQFNGAKRLRLTSGKSAASPFSTKEDFVNYLVAQYQAGNPVKILFKKATPTTEQGTPFVDPSIVYPNGTEEYIDTRTVPVPVGNETEYSEDLKGGLETILDTPSANGTYVLKATVSGGVATLGWVAE